MRGPHPRPSEGLRAQQLDHLATALVAQHLGSQDERPELELVTRIRRDQHGD